MSFNTLLFTATIFKNTCTSSTTSSLHNKMCAIGKKAAFFVDLGHKNSLSKGTVQRKHMHHLRKSEKECLLRKKGV